MEKELSSRIFRSENELTLSTVEKHVLWLLLNEIFSPAPAPLDKQIMSILTTQDFYRARLEQAREKLTPMLLGGPA